MKVVLRIFNVFIMAISVVASYFLFATPTISFKSKIALNVESFSKFIPTTKFSDKLNVPTMLGTDSIYIGIKFDIYSKDAPKFMSGDRQIINNSLISENIYGILDVLHEPIQLITDYSVRTTIKNTVKNEITTQINNAKNKFATASTAEDIMDEVGMDDNYFNNFANTLYNAANAPGANIESTSNILYAQVDDALARAEDTGLIDNSGFSEEKKEEIKNNLINILRDLNLVKEDGSLKPISQISFIYIAQHFKTELLNKGYDEVPLLQGANENNQEYADRILSTHIFSIIPDDVYSISKIASISIFAGLIVIFIIWAFLFIFTFVRTFTKKPWTIFGPWFWIIGFVQLILGIGLTVFAKLILPSLKINLANLPINSFLISIRTCVLIPSMLVLACFVLAIVYLIFKTVAKHEYMEVKRK